MTMYKRVCKSEIQSKRRVLLIKVQFIRIFDAFHPEVLITHKYNTPVNNTTLYFIYTIKIVYSQGDMFRTLLGHPQALWENR